MISKDIFNEYYPEEIFHGNKPFVVKKKANDVFIPSDMLSFLFEKEYNQKTVYLNVPYTIFLSETERKNICQNLLWQSITNDIFSDFKPRQTKFVLISIKEGYFLEYYTYSYTYYFDHQTPEWGIYGGIKGDSSSLEKYINFIDGVNNDKYALYKQDSCSTNSDSLKYIYLKSHLELDQYRISNNENEIFFDKIKFNDVEFQGNVQLNFPPQSIIYRINFYNIIGELVEEDDNLFYLKYCRKEISNTYL